MHIDVATGAVVEPDFHDGHFVGLLLHKDTIEILLKTTDGETYCLSLGGIRGFEATQILAGNIVFGLNILSGRRPPADLDLDAVHPPPHPLAPSEVQEMHRAKREELAEQIAKGELMLIWMDASYGATFDALCQTASVGIYQAGA